MFNNIQKQKNASNLSVFQIGDRGVQKLAEVLQKNTVLINLSPLLRLHLPFTLQTVQTLNLHTSGIGDEGGKHLASILQINTVLRLTCPILHTNNLVFI